MEFRTSPTQFEASLASLGLKERGGVKGRRKKEGGREEKKETRKEREREREDGMT